MVRFIWQREYSGTSLSLCAGCIPMSLPLDTDELADQLRVEFRDDAQDRLDLIYQTLEKRVANKLNDEERLILLRREASKLRGIGSSAVSPWSI